jgi:hypothetical protein
MRNTPYKACKPKLEPQKCKKVASKEREGKSNRKRNDPYLDALSRANARAERKRQRRESFHQQ